MKRYLVKKIGKQLDYIAIPKGARLQKSNKRVRAIQGKKVGVWHHGYKLVRADSRFQAYEKAFGLKLKSMKP